jgi:hypothetical protein
MFVKQRASNLLASMGQILSAEIRCRSASREIPRRLQNRKVHPMLTEAGHT